VQKQRSNISYGYSTVVVLSNAVVYVESYVALTMSERSPIDPTFFNFFPKITHYKAYFGLSFC